MLTQAPLLPTPIDRFELQAHSGPYQSWPGRSRLIANGELSRTQIPGYVLLRQYALPEGYLLITDFDCPFEESTSFILLCPKLHVMSHRTLGGMYSSYLLKRVQWLSERELVASFMGRSDWRLTIRKWSVPYLLPKLKLAKNIAPA